MGPIEMWRLFRDWQKVTKQAKEMTMQNWKTTVCGLVAGVAMAIGNYQGENSVRGYVIAGALAAIGILAKDFNIQLNSSEIAAITKLLNKAPVILLALALGCAMTAMPVWSQSASPQAQGVQNFYAGGLSYGVNASPGVAGTGLYAHQLSGSSGTYAFTAIDAVPNTLKPFTVTSNLGVGIAQRVKTFGKVSVFMPTAAGVSWSGTNAGWQWNGGAIALIPLKQKGYYIAPSVRFLKSSVSNGSGYQPIIGVLFGWGK